MRHDLDDLFAAFEADPGFFRDGVDIVLFDDPATGTLWSSLLVEAEAGDAYDCRLSRAQDGSRVWLAEVRLLTDNGYAYAHSPAVTGKRVAADPDAVLALLVLARTQIRCAQAPEFDRLLFDFTGLRLPVTGYT